jgi:endonuclease G
MSNRMPKAIWVNIVICFSYSLSIPAQGIRNLEIPKTQSHGAVISHVAYTLEYNETHEQASWVAYVLTKEKTVRVAERTNKFLSDPMVKTGSADNGDYSKSGYDRGHLAPAADMGWSAKAMAESFYFSNMSPQVPAFNRGIWKRTEELVRTWAIAYDSLYIVTGPVLNGKLPSIGANQVSIPNYYYKVILDYHQPEVKAIGIIMPNADSSEPIQHFAVSVDSVEHLTGIDFFPLLNDVEESKLEKQTCIPCWQWDAHSIKSGNTGSVTPHKDSGKSGVQTGESMQCTGTTKSGNRCKRMTNDADHRCYQHK